MIRFCQHIELMWYGIPDNFLAGAADLFEAFVAHVMKTSWKGVLRRCVRGVLI
jgi:hypothetical protein